MKQENETVAGKKGRKEGKVMYPGLLPRHLAEFIHYQLVLKNKASNIYKLILFW